MPSINFKHGILKKLCYFWILCVIINAIGEKNMKKTSGSAFIILIYIARSICRFAARAMADHNINTLCLCYDKRNRRKKDEENVGFRVYYISKKTVF